MCVPGEFVLVGDREQTIETGTGWVDSALVQRDEATQSGLFTDGV